MSRTKHANPEKHRSNRNRIFALALALLLFPGYGSAQEAETDAAEGTERMFYAHVNGSVLSVSAEDNSSADAFLDLLKAGDVQVNMHDYGGFEKVGPLPWDLPRNDEQITTVPGDIILYQGSQITVYYDQNSWEFTRLAKIENVTGEELRRVLGEGGVTVSFWLEWSE